MIKVQQPVYYWCSYWLKWDEILGWNEEKNYIIVREVGSDKIRQHCTTIEKNHLSTIIINRSDYKTYDDFKEKLKSESGKAWTVLRDSGIPRWILKFED